MTDLVSVAATYAIVLGGLALYVASIARRLRAARRVAEAVSVERERDAAGGRAESPAQVARPSDPSR
jgi:hypothetical protein